MTQHSANLDRTAVTAVTQAGEGERSFALIVLDAGSAAVHPLVGNNEFSIGRGGDCAIAIEESSVSRTHATLCVATMTVRDCSSANGTFVRGERVAPGSAVTIAVDEVFKVGRVSVMVRVHRAISDPEVLGPNYFALRVGEECARAVRTGSTFAVVRVDGDRMVELKAVIGAGHVIGRIGPRELAVLMPGATQGDGEQLAVAIERALGVTTALSCFPRDAKPIQIAHPRTDGMAHIEQLLGRVAGGTISVLILGETGVGKEVLAERIHKASKRAAKPFLRLNCAALSESLLESELFGHEKGSFTGATATKVGLLESADGGTVFLDEIGEMPMATQVKLLRVLEQREVQRVGGLAPRAIDVRFVAATHRDLQTMISAGTFRQDLYFRLNGITLTIPPLRERVGEIEQLARLFIARAAEANAVREPELSDEALESLRSYAWPGNIRELRNVIERAVLLAVDSICARSLMFDHQRAAATPRSGDDSERARILKALANAAGNQKLAAQLLGISRRTLINRIIGYGIARPRKTASTSCQSADPTSPK